MVFGWVENQQTHRMEIGGVKQDGTLPNTPSDTHHNLSATDLNHSYWEAKIIICDLFVLLNIFGYSPIFGKLSKFH